MVEVKETLLKGALLGLGGTAAFLTMSFVWNSFIAPAITPKQSAALSLGGRAYSMPYSGYTASWQKVD